MTITIDDGTFLVGNSFVTLDETDTYHEDRATETWIATTVTDDQKEAALIKAFDYLYVQNWIAGVFDTEIPIRVKQAQMVAAGKELSSPGSLQADQDSNVKRKNIEGAIETEYFSKSLSSAPVFTQIQNLLKPYLNTSIYNNTAQRFLVRM
jgi:hypothetical protein